MNILYKANTDDCGKQLKSILKNKLYISNILRYNLIKFNKITVNGNICFPNLILKQNDEIKVILDNDTDLKTDTYNFYEKFPAYNFNLDILYEDEYLLIINKPANIEIHPCATNHEKTLSNAVFNYLRKQNILNIHIVTRLDKNTTGICIFAKHKYIQELFVRKKEQINLQKIYTAIVNGIIKNDHGIIEKNIVRDDNSIILRKTCTSNYGEYAKTEYFVTCRNYDKNYSVVNVILHTGKTHQIRVHFTSINHPLLGDSLYSNDEHIKENIQRQALHCNKIIFNHPILQKELTIISDIPEDMKKLI